MAARQGSSNKERQAPWREAQAEAEAQDLLNTLTMRADELMDAGRWSASLARREQIAALGPMSPGHFFKHIALLRKLGHVHAAHQLFLSHPRKARKRNAEFLLVEAAVRRDMGQWRAALDVAKQAEALAMATSLQGSKRRDKIRLSARLDQLETLKAMGSWERRAAQAKADLAEFPNVPQLAAILSSSAHLDMALKEVRKLPAPQLIAVAQALEAKGHLAKARERLQAAWDRAPQRLDLGIELAEFDLRHGAAPTAFSVAQKLLDLSETFLPAALVQARATAQSGDLPAAIAMVSALDISPTAAPGVSLDLGRYLALAGQDAREIEVYKRALERFPGHPKLLSRLLAAASHLDAQGADGALQWLDDQGMNSWASTRLRAQRLFKRGHFDRALDVAREIPTSRRDADSALGLARALSGQGRHALAQRYLSIARRRWPRDARLRAHSLESLSVLGRHDAALGVVEAEMSVETGSAGRCLSELFRAQLESGAFDMALATARALLAEGLPLFAACDDGPGALSSLDAPVQQQTSWRHVAAELEKDARANKGRAMVALRQQDRASMARFLGHQPTSTLAAMRLLSAWEDTPAVASKPIPKRLHHFWSDARVPGPVADMLASWDAEPGYQRQVFDTVAATSFLKRDYGPKWARAFERASSVSEAADFLRLCLLARVGGIYVDADVVRRSPITPLVKGAAGLVVYTERTFPVLGTSFLAARPKHPVMIVAARMARAALLEDTETDRWSKTGPGLLTRVLARYLGYCTSQGQTADVTLLSEAQVLAHVSLHMRENQAIGAQDWAPAPHRARSASLGALLTEHISAVAHKDG
ncbi:glycosyltransferase [Roseobacteraceae bacterium S113]